MYAKKDFGVALKAYRMAANLTVADVADSVEIPVFKLQAIESGKDVPSEDILELIISHLSLRDTEALRLYELAGYSYDQDLGVTMADDKSDKPKELNVNMPQDMQILYTDMMHVTGNNYGIVLNFIQGVGPNGNPVVVSRLGMSREHANSMIEALKRGLENPGT